MWLAVASLMVVGCRHACKKECKCASTEEAVTEETAQSKSAVDISSLVQEYQHRNKATEDSLQEVMWRSLTTDSIVMPTGVEQGLCTLDRWWIEEDELTDSAKSDFDFVGVYNAYALINSVWADYEILARSVVTESEPLVPQKDIAAAIKGAPVDMLPAQIKGEAKQFRDEMGWLINNVNKWTEQRAPSVAFLRYDSLITERVVTPYMDMESVSDYYTKLDSLMEKYKPVQTEIAKLDEASRFDEVLKRVAAAKTYEEQCGIVLASCSKSTTFNGIWSIRLLEMLLDSGRASLLSERMWMAWRAMTQRDVCGMSRDAYMPNYAYDRLRKKVYCAIASDSENKDRRLMTAQALMLASDRCLIRNGSYIAGNDAAIEIMNCFPDFYEEQ